MPGSHHCQRTMSQSRDEVGGTTSREKRPLPGHFSDDIGGESLQQRCEFHREGGFEPPCAARAHESEETGSLWRNADGPFLFMAARSSTCSGHFCPGCRSGRRRCSWWQRHPLLRGMVKLGRQTALHALFFAVLD
jgi:hypothetical protein